LTYDSQLLHRALRHALQAGAEIHVLHIERALVAIQVHPVRKETRRGSGRQRNLLAAGNGRVVNEQLAVAGAVHPVDSKAGLVRAPRRSALRIEGDQVVVLVDGQRILEQFALLTEEIVPVGDKGPHRRDALQALVFLRTLASIQTHQFAALVGVMAGADHQDALRSRDRLGMDDRPRRVRVVAVKLDLRGPIGVHHEQLMHLAGDAVIVLPPRVHNPAIVEDLRVQRVRLVVSQPPQVTPLAVAAVQVRDVR
jgi:hypothetical protein